MSTAAKTSRAQVWLDSLGDWSWPGRAAEAVDVRPPSWVPAFPPRLEPLAIGPIASEPATAPWRRRRASLLGLGALAALCATLAVSGRQDAERLLGLSATASAPQAIAPTAATPSPLLPTLVGASADAAGSSIDTATFASAAIAGQGSFHVYLPPGYASTTQRYPVLYLLHGNDQPATAFLEIGLQGELDTLIARHEIPPLIAVMIQGGRGANNWRNQGTLRYESYVLEVQELVDRMLPTVASRGARAIAGDSMGGYGAMNVALGNPQRFSVVESWLGFFNGLEGELHSAAPVIAREGLHAFVYGGASDHIADPGEDAPFAAQLRAAGASAHGTVYPGEHSMETLHANLSHMLVYAGRALSENAAAQASASSASGGRRGLARTSG